MDGKESQKRDASGAPEPGGSHPSDGAHPTYPPSDCFLPSISRVLRSISVALFGPRLVWVAGTTVGYLLNGDIKTKTTTEVLRGLYCGSESERKGPEESALRVGTFWKTKQKRKKQLASS